MWFWSNVYFVVMGETVNGFRFHMQGIISDKASRLLYKFGAFQHFDYLLLNLLIHFAPFLRLR